ncbi:hypothetical protein [Ilumatobacter coccineus]|uniref:Uncharacterized protein n=1 Tax=Ilumatobacter coccineus (strain NBRC 103263 / KCTC 29153 / YM16-304) TaxID=1313172 RepID=A0A6C7DUG3_ILUCY|nr:hypothetical protein [Ilumatobacter coccineus]BAN00534.1 hypothetical protein YM304_02200 [Ilumatobacter coccineus YM16-304]
MERAAAPHRPKRTMRCPIPSWFADLQSDVANQLAAANVEVDRELREVDGARVSIAAAKVDLFAAQRAMAPFQPSLDQARQDVKNAQQEMWSAHRRLERSGRVKRRAARRDAKRADEELRLVNERLGEAKTLAAPAQQKIDASRAAIDRGESSISTLRTIYRWSGNEIRLDRLAELDSALLTWREWAAGELAGDIELSRSVDIMKANENPEWQQPLAYLTEAATDWPEHSRQALRPHLQVGPPTVRRGLGIDW